MDKLDKKKVDLLIHNLAEKYGLPRELIKQIVESPYEFSAEVIQELDMDGLTEEQVNNLKTNFIYTGFAKLYLSPGAVKKKFRRKNKFNLNK